MRNFRGEPQRLKLPSAPKHPIIIRDEEYRPQPRLDRMMENGMAIVVGRVRKDPVLDGVKFVVVGHNTIRGGAGNSVLTAEFLKAKGII
jgi:aspartate-semialdehyde dehydrogenase